MDQKWNIQDIRPAKSVRKKAPAAAAGKAPSVHDSTAESVPPKRTVKKRIPKTPRSRKSGRNIVLSIIAFFVLMGIGLMITAQFNNATVEIVQRTRTISIESDFTSYIESREGELSHEILALEATAARTVEATGEEEVSERAEGVVAITNTSDEDLRLIKNTRLESPDGLIFKLSESAEVPAGDFINVEVFAEGAGAVYNIPPSKFTVPGLAGDPLFEKITGESTKSFSGGFTGIAYSVNQTEEDATREALQADLVTALNSQLAAEAPDAFVVFADAAEITYKSLPTEKVGEGEVSLKEQATLRVPVFDRSTFGSFLASRSVPGFDGEAIVVTNPEVLQFTMDAGSSGVDASTFSFTLAGDVELRWEFDEVAFKNTLLDSSKNDLETIKESYPAILDAKASLTPAWSSSFPSDPENITISVVDLLPEN